VTQGTLADHSAIPARWYARVRSARAGAVTSSSPLPAAQSAKCSNKLPPVAFPQIIKG